MLMRGRVALALMVALAIVLAGPLARSAPTARAAIVPHSGFTQIVTTGPLTEIDVGVDTTMQVVDHRVSTGGEFYYYPQTSCTADLAIFVNLGNRLYGPNPGASWHCAHSIMNPPDVVYTPLSQTSAGNGSSTSPYTVTTTVRLTAAVTLTQKVTYVTGQNVIGESATLSNSGSPLVARIFDGAEPDPGSIEDAFGYYDPVTKAVGAYNPVDPKTGKVYACTSGQPSPYQYSVYFSPVTPWQHSVVDQYNTVFDAISASDTGASLPDHWVTQCIDPAAAVEWDVSLGQGASITVSKNIVFSSNLPPLHPGTVSGQAQCSAISAPTITCDPIPGPCQSCGSSYNFLLPATCASGPTIDLQNRVCTGAFVGHVGFTSFDFSLSSGGITPTPRFGGTATLTGFSAVLGTGVIVVTDNDVTGVDTVQLTGRLNYTWTCHNLPSCLEVISRG